MERQVVAFLRSLEGRAGSLLINGDLFDFWFEWRSVMPRGHFRVLAALADLRESGVPITLVAGNHDCWGGEILTRDVGIEYHVGRWTGTLGGWNTLVEHGDGLRAVEDRRYRALRRLLRARWAIRAFGMLHPTMATRLASGSSEASRVHASKRRDDGGSGLRRIATQELSAHPDLELVIYGHSHVSALERVTQNGVYANPGSWLNDPSFLVITPDSIELRRWTGATSAESELLNSLDRRAEEPLSNR
jgi:UDP-2,3-diacylglucosamine hydrolase